MPDADFVPVEMGIHVKLPIYIHSETERLKSRPVRIMFEWLADVFSTEKPMFAPELNLDVSPRDAVPHWMRHVSIAADLLPPAGH